MCSEPSRLQTSRIASVTVPGLPPSAVPAASRLPIPPPETLHIPRLPPFGPPPAATVRANSTPVSSKAILQKLPLRVYKRLEEMIATCSYMEWKHFDAGVVKVRRAQERASDVVK